MFRPLPRAPYDIHIYIYALRVSVCDNEYKIFRAKAYAAVATAEINFNLVLSNTVTHVSMVSKTYTDGAPRSRRRAHVPSALASSLRVRFASRSPRKARRRPFCRRDSTTMGCFERARARGIRRLGGSAFGRGTRPWCSFEEISGLKARTTNSGGGEGGNPDGAGRSVAKSRTVLIDLESSFGTMQRFENMKKYASADDGYETRLRVFDIVIETQVFFDKKTTC